MCRDTEIGSYRYALAIVASPEHVVPRWILEAAAQHQEPPEDLGSAASRFLETLYTAPDWPEVDGELNRLLRDDSVEGIEALWQSAGRMRRMAVHLDIHDGFDEPQDRKPDPFQESPGASDRDDVQEILDQVEATKQKEREDTERALAADLEAAEEAFRAHATEIAEQLPEIAKTAAKTPSDAPLAQTAARIAGIVRHADKSRLGPYWMLIVLYWLIVHLNVDNMAALTLWYMVASDTFKKKD